MDTVELSHEFIEQFQVIYFLIKTPILTICTWVGKVLFDNARESGHQHLLEQARSELIRGLIVRSDLTVQANR